ncbi:MAG: DUF3024 domain-containing protein [Nitrospirae bacterium]|nr:DUF3024 domain-containing protein [Nitrospirota bacterium]
MPLPVLVKTLVEKKVGEYCKNKVPPDVLSELNISYNIRGNSITLFENRAPWRPDMKEWTSMPIAQMRYDNKTGEWTLYCVDRNDKWHKYLDFDPTKNIDELLVEINKDPTGIFWG